MRIYAVRHGLTDYNKRDILNGHIDEPLIAEGIEQAEQVIDSIPKTVTHIYVSALLRAKQTAEIINKELKLPISHHDELKEVNLGSFTGKSWKEIKLGEKLRKEHRSLRYDYRPEGESVADVKKRVLSFLEKINETHSSGEVLIVTHGGIIRIFQLLESGLPSLPMNHVKNASLYTFDLKKILKNNANAVLPSM